MKSLLVAGWMCLSLALWAAGDLTVVPDPVPGLYGSTTTVKVSAAPDIAVQYRFLESADNGFLPWSDALVLSAMPGETRVYTLRLQTTNPAGESLTRDYRYTIARPAKPLPSVTPSPGISVGPVVLQATLPPGVHVYSGSQLVSFPLTLSGTPGESTTYRLEPRSDTASDGQFPVWTYVVDLRGQSAVALDVLSPLPGTWLNKQTLVLNFQGLEQVSWSWGAKWDPTQAQLYTKPVFLDKSGPLAITVSGKVKGSDSPVVKTVSWSNGEAVLKDWALPEAGVSRDALVFPANPSLELSLDDGHNWKPLDKDRQEPLITPSLKVIAPQFRQTGKAGVARGVYWMDSRTPAPAQLDYWGGWNPRVSFSGTTDSWNVVEWVATDGKRSLSEGQWGPSGSWKIPDGVISASVKSVMANGMSSTSPSKEFPETGWIRPVWEPWDAQGVLTSKTVLPLGGRLVPRAGFQGSYEVAGDREVPEPGAASPLLTGPFLPQVPVGVDRTFYVRFAWRDESGVVGPPTPAIAIRVDHQSPPAPRISVLNKKIVLQSDDADPGVRLSYAVSGQKLKSAESLTFQTYTAPLDLDQLSGASKEGQWLHALAQDPSGNVSAARLNYPLGSGAQAYEWKGLLQVDSDLPGGTAALGDAAVLARSRLTLRASYEGDVTSVFWMQTASAQLPAAWDASMLPADRPILGIDSGDRKTFYTWWNLKNSQGWIWDKPRLYTVTLDQGPPAAPQLTGAAPGAVLGDAWSVSAKPGQTGDVLTYTLTRDGTAAPDPLGLRGLPWPGTLVLDVADSEAATFRLRIAASSVSGLTREVPALAPITIDKTTPAALSLPLEPFTYSNKEFSLAVDAASASMHWQVTLDGSLPAIPDLRSPEVKDAPLNFPGTAGKQTLYRFRLRPFSASGKPGPSTEAFSILVDRTSTPAANLAENTGTGAFTVSGIPETGLSSQPVKAVISSPWGQLRYELTEGKATFRPVDSSSPPFPGTLSLDGVEGADRTYTLGVRGYSSDGNPLTPEARWNIRIDRSPPAAPALQLIPDARRPEAVVKVVAAAREDQDSVLYRWTWTSFPSGSGAQDWTAVGDGEIRFAAPSGLLTRLSVEARVKDAAGNSSDIVQAGMLLDRNVVYVSSSAKTSGDGSRENPAPDLATAVAKMRREGRKILLIGTGTYLLTQSQDWTDFAVWGGLDAVQWESTTQWGRSTVGTAAGFSSKDLIESYAGKLELHRVNLQADSAGTESLVKAEGTSVIAEQTSWQSKGVAVAWKQSGGDLSLDGLDAVLDSSRQGSVLSLSQVDFRLHNLTWTSKNNQDARLFVLNQSQGIVSGLTLSTSKDGGLDTFLWAQSSRLTANDLKISVGDGAAWSSAFVLAKTQATLVNVEVNLSAERGNTGFQLASSDVDLQKNHVEILKGVEFNQGFSLQDSQLKFFEGTIQIDAGSYQGGISQYGGSVNAQSSRVALTGGGKKAWGLQTLGDCVVQLANMTWALQKKTEGKAILADSTWLDGSADKDSLISGW